jgi:nucleotide-binding universal stress UspA family protein
MFRKILVPVIGSQADEEVIKLACRLARQDKSEIHALHIITVKRDLPLDAEIQPEIQKAEDILNRAETVAKEQNYKIDTNLLQARQVGQGIIDEAVKQGFDLILMGLSYKRRFGEFSLGDVVPYVLKNAPCYVIIYSMP